MVFTHHTLNNFARTLSRHIAQRAVGLDTASQQIIGVRPAKHILAGFLTPMHIEEKKTPEDVNIEDELTEDLPQDSQYEQTAIGFEWLTPREELHQNAAWMITVEGSVYVRRLPTFEEQSKYGTPRTKREKSSSSVQENEPLRYEDLVMVWTREQLVHPLTVNINVGMLLQNRVVRKNIEQELREVLMIGGNLAPRRKIEVPMNALEDEDAYKRWYAGLPHRPLERFWSPVVDIRLSTVPTQPEYMRVSLRLINQTLPNTSRGQEDFFDPNMYAVSLQATLPEAAHAPSIFRELPQSYRYDRTMSGVGINVHVEHQRVNGNIILTSNTIPQKEVARLVPYQIPDTEPRFESLAKDPFPLLHRILSAMQTYYAEDWGNKINELSSSEVVDAQKDRKQFLHEIHEFERGILLLENAKYPAVARAFRLMNETMMQMGKNMGASYVAWRLFQIVFIVSMVPILAGREYPELVQPDDDRVDVLWFAAGGGKTEAFLGLILWQAFFDRLRGKKVGVTGFVRFPLRLLTFQQLQRLGNALGQAELIREREKLGGHRFSLGFFVGGQVTDNSINNDRHQRYSKHGLDDSQKRIFQCTFCLAPTRLEYNQSVRLIEHYCTRLDCPGGKQRLPVYVVDDDLYRYLPTVIVSTVDKMAGFGQNQRFTNLLGRFDMICPVHGASFINANYARCPGATGRKNGERPIHCEPGKAFIDYGPFHDPGPALLVQDELHLLSEELGTFDSHYETAIAETSRSFGYKPWKVIAATATIQAYEKHAWQLYLQAAQQFPCPGPTAYESFYYKLNQESIGRIFIGLLGVGRKHTPAVTRTLTLTYLELDAARKLSEQDPQLAASAYGTDQLSPIEWRFLLFLYELPLIYTLTRKGSDMVAEAIESHVKKDLHELVHEFGDLMIEMFNSGIDVPEMIETMQTIKSADPHSSEPSDRIRGLVTTNIIGHGVDVDRFNIMIFAGFPRLVSEYIQASARVGRMYPGISIFVATPQSERDRGVFNRFTKFHEYLDRLVDPSALARWPLPAVERTVPGILAGYLMGVAANTIGAGLATVEKVQYYFGRLDAEALTTEQILAWMHKAYGTKYASSQARYIKKLETVVQNRYATVINKTKHAGAIPTSLNGHLDAMRSLRDIDDPGYIHVEDQTDIKIVRRLIRGED